MPTPGPALTAFEEEIIASTNAIVFHREEHGELAADDHGRDWFTFDAVGGKNYIIELKNRWYVSETVPEGVRWGFEYVPGHLIDPSILEIVDSNGDQVLGERDQGGFMGNFARAFFTPVLDGPYYVAVGPGAQDREGLGHYTISVRLDDHADDFRSTPQVPIRPGESISATIDSDVSPDDPGLNPWDWTETFGEYAIPTRGDESPDDRDVFRLEIPQAGRYRVSVDDAPNGVGVWSILGDTGNALYYNEDLPAPFMEFDAGIGSYCVEIGTPYHSEGNTGAYTVTLEAVGD